MVLRICKIFSGLLYVMCVLVVARFAANAVAKLCKLVSCPSTCVLTCGHHSNGKGHHVVSRV